MVHLLEVPRGVPIWIWALQGVVFLTSVALTLRGLTRDCQSKHRGPLGILATGHNEEVWSPLLGVIESMPLRFDADLNAPSPFTGVPSNDIDAAWSNIIDRPMILIDEQGVKAIGESPVNAKQKNGEYYALVEVFHQLHCLNLLRKAIWRSEYSDATEFLVSTKDIGVHVDHCINLLRQVLMCKADVGLILFDDEGPENPPMPRFSNRHTCRNFSAIVEWVDRNDAERSL